MLVYFYKKLQKMLDESTDSDEREAINTAIFLLKRIIAYAYEKKLHHSTKWSKLSDKEKEDVYFIDNIANPICERFADPQAMIYCAGCNYCAIFEFEPINCRFHKSYMYDFREVMDSIYQKDFTKKVKIDRSLPILPFAEREYSMNIYVLEMLRNGGERLYYDYDEKKKSYFTTNKEFLKHIDDLIDFLVDDIVREYMIEHEHDDD